MPNVRRSYIYRTTTYIFSESTNIDFYKMA